MQFWIHTLTVHFYLLSRHKMFDQSVCTLNSVFFICSLKFLPFQQQEFAVSLFFLFSKYDWWYGRHFEIKRIRNLRRFFILDANYISFIYSFYKLFFIIYKIQKLWNVLERNLCFITALKVLNKNISTV